MNIGSRVESHSSASVCEPLVIALVNNMPDAALQSTERQFSELLGAAGAHYDLRLRLFSFPELVRGESGRAYVAQHYEPIECLWREEFDGLIVTGAEPRTPFLSDEVYWPSITRLIDRAIDTATPAIWSCLAAHAAVLYLDGIERYRLPEKISGVFRCAKTADHSLLSGMPGAWRIPHSRLNALDPVQLVAAGYELLSLSEDAGADTFVQHRGAPFVFFQGHPEYDAGALFREYRRDVGRFLAGSMERYPELPQGYVDLSFARDCIAFRSRAEGERRQELFGEFPPCSPMHTPHVWREPAVRLYENWLSSLAGVRGSASLIRETASVAAPVA